MEKYKEKFGECFPLMLTRGMSDENVKEQRVKSLLFLLGMNKKYIMRGG